MQLAHCHNSLLIKVKATQIWGIWCPPAAEGDSLHQPVMCECCNKARFISAAVVCVCSKVCVSELVLQMCCEEDITCWLLVCCSLMLKKLVCVCVSCEALMCVGRV